MHRVEDDEIGHVGELLEHGRDVGAATEGRKRFGVPSSRDEQLLVDQGARERGEVGADIDIGVAGSEGQGTRPSLTPEHSGTVWTTYRLTPRFRVGAGLNLRGKQTPNRNPGWEADAYVTGDLMAEYTFDFERIVLKANLTNVTDKLYADQLYSGHYIPGAGRTLQVTASFKF